MLRLQFFLIVLFLTLNSSSFAATQTVCATPQATIPDNNPVGISQTLTINDTNIISGLRLSHLAITHQHIGELTMTLKHGDRMVKILDKPGIPASKYGCTGKNFSDLTISDVAAVTLEDACTSTDPAYDNSLIYKPNESLEVFNGLSAAGEWTLTVADNYDYNQAVGKLEQWCLEYSQPSSGTFFSEPAPGTPLIFNTASYPTGSKFTIPVKESSGKDSLLITNVLITAPGNATSDFSITQPKTLPKPSAPLIIQPGQLYQFEAQCMPSDVGLRTATLEIHTNLPAPLNQLSYPLQCDGQVAWFESITPSSVDFGKVAVGESSQQIIQLSEQKGASTLKIAKASIIGTHKNDFRLINSKFPMTILQKGSAELPVTCQPTAGGLRSAKLVLTTNAPNALSFTYELKCLGDAAVASFKPVERSQIAIEKVGVGTRKSYKIGVRNANTATAALKLYEYQIIDSQNSKLFKLISQPSLIEIGGSGQIEVACDAAEATPGTYSATLRFATNDPTKLIIEYSVTCSIDQAKPLVSLTPAKGSTIQFDRIKIGAKNKLKTIVLENAATASTELELSNPSISGAGAAAFSVVAIPLKIGIGLQDEIKVQCSAETGGNYTATLTISTNDPTQPTLDYPLNCSVSDVVAPLYDSQPAPNTNTIIDLGNVVLQQPSPPTAILIRESGNDVLRVSDPQLSGEHVNDFKVISPTFPVDIADDAAAIPLQVTCQPSAMGVRTATLTLQATDLNGKSVENFPQPQYQLQCTGYLPIYNSVNYPIAGEIDLGINSIGQNTMQNLFIKNTGNGDLIVDKAEVLLNGADAENFNINSLPVTIAAGKTKSVGIQCAPKMIGNLQAQLQLSSNDPQQPLPKYTLKCTGQEAVGASYYSKPAPNTPIIFDTTQGSTATAILTVQEVGTAVLDVGMGAPLLDGEDAQDFSIDISTGSPFIDGKEHFYIPDNTPPRELKITCKPTGTGQRHATLRLTSNDPNHAEINYPLVCNSGAISAGYQSQPLPETTLDCGTVQVGKSATRTVEISETANADLTVALETPEDAQLTDFKIMSPTFPFTIKDGSGEHKTVTIECKPSDVGIRTAELRLTTNDLSKPVVRYPLKVTGSNMLGAQLILKTQGKGRGKIISSPQGLVCGETSSAGQVNTACATGGQQAENGTQDIECSAYFNRGTAVTLTVQAETGSVFRGWNAECATGSLTLQEDTTCVAEFADAPSVESAELELNFIENSELDFSIVNVGDAVTRTLQVKNKTAQAVKLSNFVIPSGLSLAHSSEITVAAQQTIDFTIFLDTTQQASILGTFAFQAEGKTYSFAARAKIVSSDALLNISYPNATELDFGAVKVGDTVTREVVISNRSAQAVTVDAISLPTEITGNLNLPITLAAQQKVTVQLQFKPMIEGHYATTWSFNAHQKVYTLQAKAQVKTPVAANGCYTAARLYVNKTAVGKATGLNWTDAFSDVSAALSYANQCDTVREIWVAQGSYRPTSSTDRTATFQLRSNLALYGGFVGTETELAQRDVTANLTTLSGDIGKTDEATDNSSHLVTLNAAENVRLDGFNIVAGQADDGCGGGISSINSQVQLLNLTLAHNYAKQGGGLCAQNSQITLKDAVLTENRAIDGAAVANLAQSHLTIGRVSITGNQAVQQGGALFNDRSEIQLSHGIIQNNQAAEGGAWVNIVATATLSHVLFQGNQADQTAVMLNRQSEVRLSHATVSGNAAKVNSGIVNVNSKFTVQNSILWDNHAVGAKQAEEPINDDANSRTAISNSIIQSATLGKGTNKNRNPLFVKAVDFTDPQLQGDLHLQATSPAIDMGNAAQTSPDFADIDPAAGDGITTTAITQDLDYQPRESDGNGDGKMVVDAGVYEYSATPALRYPLTVKIAGTGKGKVSSSLAGINCGMDTLKCNTTYLANTRLNLQASAANGSQFSGWTGDCEGSTPTLAVVISQDRQCTAHFEAEHLATTCDQVQITQPCDAAGKTLTNVTIYGDGNVRNAMISGQVTNQGWLNNIVVTAKSQVTGGKITGAVQNKGTLDSFEFYGTLLAGGTLSGDIFNKNPNATIRDVHLAPATMLKGGRVAGKIIGDTTEPARLANVIIAAGSQLQNVVLEGTIVIESPAPVTLDVQLAPDVQINGGKISGKLRGDATAPARLVKTQIVAGTQLQHVRFDSQNTLSSQTCNRLTENITSEINQLKTSNEAEAIRSDFENHTAAFSKAGQALTQVAALFSSRIITDQGEQANKTILSSEEAKALRLNVSVQLDQKHVNRAGEILVAAIFTDDAGQLTRYMKTTQGWTVWDGQLENLQSVQSFSKLPSQIDLSLFAGDLSGLAGQFEIYSGYRLKDGTVVYNGQRGIQFSILPKTAACQWTCACAQ